MQLALLTTCST